MRYCIVSIVLLLCAWLMLFYYCPSPSQFSIDKSFCVEEFSMNQSIESSVDTKSSAK